MMAVADHYKCTNPVPDYELVVLDRELQTVVACGQELSMVGVVVVVVVDTRVLEGLDASAGT